MSMENVKKFLELVKTDEGLARKVVELKDSLQKGANLGSEVEILAEKVLPLAKAHGLEFTVEEFWEYSNSMSGELSDDDLLNVSGGISARGVALGLLFATGLSFVPSILSSFAEGPGGSAPAAPETSYSQSYSSELEENSAMELKEREAEKEVRSSRDDVRRAGNQVRTAQKRVDTLKSKLQKEASSDDINGLSKKQKKKFSKLINQIAMAEEDLKAAEGKLKATKGKTGTKSNVNVEKIKERKNAQKTAKEKGQHALDDLKRRGRNKWWKLEEAIIAADNTGGDSLENAKKLQTELLTVLHGSNADAITQVTEKVDDVVNELNNAVEQEKKEKKVVEAAEKEKTKDEEVKQEDMHEGTEKDEGKEEQKVEKETVEEKKEEVAEEKKEEIVEEKKEKVDEEKKEEEDRAEDKSDEQMKAELVKLLKDNSLVYSSKGEIKGFPANIVTAMLYARYPNYSKLEVEKQLQAKKELKDKLPETKQMLTATIQAVHSEADSTQVDGLVSQCMTIISSSMIGDKLPNQGALVKQIQVKDKIDELSDTYGGTMSEESKDKLKKLKKEASGAAEEKLAKIEETLTETEETLKKEAEQYNAKLGYLKNRTSQINENLYDFMDDENYDTLDAKYQAIDREWKKKKPDLKQIEETLAELEQLTQQKNVVDEVANAGNNKKFLQLEEEAKQQKTEKEILQERLNNGNIDLFGLSDNKKELEKKLKEPNTDLEQIKTEIDKLEFLANAKKECLDRLESIKGDINGLALIYYGFNTEAFENRSDSIDKKLKKSNANLDQIKSEIENLESLVKAKETLLAINNSIKELKKHGKDTLALERKYDNVSDMLNKGDDRVDEVQRAVTALEGSLSNVDNLSKVKFKGKGWFHDGTVENVYNSLKDADFDIDRIENQKQDQTWEAAFNFVLKTMNISKDGKTLEAKAERSACGTGEDDYQHKAMLKTLALFAMEREGKVKKGTAKTVADPSTATEKAVEINDISGLKEFVESKK